MYLKKDDTFCSTNDLIFSWLTNCADLEEMTLAVFNPLHKEEHKIFLTKYERLKNFSIEISVVFNGDAATIAEEFVSQFAELLKAMYKQQIYITDIRKEEKRAGMPKYLTDYQNGCKERAESLGIFQKRDRLAELSEEIENKRIIEQMKKSLCLAKAKR